MLKLDDYDSVDGHSKGTLRSLDTNQPTYVGWIPHPDEKKLGNLTHIAINLGLTKIAGNFRFDFQCVAVPQFLQYSSTF